MSLLFSICCIILAILYSIWLCLLTSVLLFCFNRHKYCSFVWNVLNLLQRNRKEILKSWFFHTWRCGWVQISTVVASFMGVWDRTTSFNGLERGQKLYFKLLVHHKSHTHTWIQCIAQTFCTKRCKIIFSWETVFMQQMNYLCVKTCWFCQVLKIKCEAENMILSHIVYIEI